MKRAISKRIGTAALALLLCALCLAPASAFAAGFDEVKDDPCSLTVTYAPDGSPMEGVEFQLWRVADISGRGYTPLEDIWSYHVLLGSGNWLVKANTLYGYLLRDGVAADHRARTDAEGTVRFEGLERGLYLVVGAERTRDGYIYRPTPFLISLPYTQDLYSWTTGVATLSKYSRSAVVRPTPTPTPPGPGTPDDPGTDPGTISRHVLKVWDDEGFEDQRPDEVTVDLLRDGEVYDTAVLTAAGSWRHDWTGLEADRDWRVVERELEDYSVGTAQEGITFVVTNTWREETDIGGDDPPLDDDPDLPPDDPGAEDPPEEQIWDDDPPLDDGPDLPDDPSGDPGDGPGDDPGEGPGGTPGGGEKLPQTGLLWWPVPLLAMGGVALMLIGWMRRRRWSAEDVG